MKHLLILCQFCLILIPSAHAVTRADLPKSLLLYEQTQDQLLCWLYCSHTILDYYGKVTGGPVPSIDDTWLYGNGKVNEGLKLWGKPLETTGHTYQDVLCELGGIYSLAIDGEIPQKTIESEINAKRPVAIVLDYRAQTNYTHLVTVYSAGTSPLNEWVEYVDPILRTGKALRTREQLNSMDGQYWGKTFLMRTSPGATLCVFLFICNYQ